MKATYGSHNKKTSYFLIRLPHDLREDLDRASKLTGRSRSKILFDAARLYLEDLFNKSATAKAIENKPKE